MRASLTCAMFLLAACGAPPKPMLTRRHAAQFQCSEGTVTVRDLGGNTWLVNGCGKRATYKCDYVSSSGNDADCRLESIEGADGTTSLPASRSE